MRQSIQSLAASENQSLNESAVAGALAEYMMYGSAARPTASIDTETRRIGEEMILEKINKIFDEAQKDNKEFEDSYQSLKKPQSFADTSI